MGSAPIRHDVTLEAHEGSEVESDLFVVLTSPSTVDLVVAAHEGRYVSVDGSLERRIVHLEVGSLIDDLRDGLAVIFLRVVNEVLCVGKNLLRLDTFDDMRN